MFEDHLSMTTLSVQIIVELLSIYVGDEAVPLNLYEKLSTYLDLLIHWNARTNLTSIRGPHEIVNRHFGESLFLGLNLPPVNTLLDFGSGAGFPGIPIQLLRPGIQVTLAESQGKKASFLREVIRNLGLPSEVWSGRVQDLPPHRQFDAVTLRAVDNMTEALVAARLRVKEGGILASFVPHEQQGLDLPGNYGGKIHLLVC